MNEEAKGPSVVRAMRDLGVQGPGATELLSKLWDESFELGRLAALDELQDRFCVCMK